MGKVLRTEIARNIGILVRFFCLDVQGCFQRIRIELVHRLADRGIVRVILLEDSERIVAGNIFHALHLGKPLERLLKVQDLVLGSVRVEINADVYLVLDGGRGAIGDKTKNDDRAEDEKRERRDRDRRHGKPPVPPEILDPEMENARNDGEHGYGALD